MCLTSSGAGCLATSCKQDPVRALRPLRSSLTMVSLLSINQHLPSLNNPHRGVKLNTEGRFFFHSTLVPSNNHNFCYDYTAGTVLSCQRCESYLRHSKRILTLTLTPGVIPFGMFQAHWNSSDASWHNTGGISSSRSPR